MNEVVDEVFVIMELGWTMVLNISFMDDHGALCVFLLFYKYL